MFRTYNKYRNQWTEYNGRKYQSKKEAGYAQELDFMLKAKEIKSWEPQIRMPIIVEGIKICDYVCDFKIVDKDGKLRYVDVKGAKNTEAYKLFRLKKKLIEATYKIKIEEK